MTYTHKTIETDLQKPEIQINPEIIIERLKRIEFQLSIKQQGEDGEEKQPYTLVN